MVTVAVADSPLLLEWLGAELNASLSAKWPMSRTGDSLGADAQEVESRVSVQVGVTVRDWRRVRFPRKYSGRN